MKLHKPGDGLDYITVIWMAYALLMFWWIPDWRLSLFGLLLLCGLLASIGIWFDIRISGYIFAIVNLIGAVLGAMLMAGFFLPDRPFSWKSILMILVLLSSAYIGFRWAMGHTQKPSRNAE